MRVRKIHFVSCSLLQSGDYAIFNANRKIECAFVVIVKNGLNIGHYYNVYYGEFIYL